MFLLPLIFIAITKIYTIPSNHVQTFFRKEIFLEILISFCDDQLGQQSLGCWIFVLYSGVKPPSADTVPDHEMQTFTVVVAI